MLENPHQLPFELFGEVLSVIMDTGFMGSAEDYVREYYQKDFSELTVIEAELIVSSLKDKPGCLYGGKPEELKPLAGEGNAANS